MTISGPGKTRPLRPDDVVEVKSAVEILATLDDNGALDNMPFMPEMLRHAGKRYTVSRRVDKICDTIARTGSRRMRDTVFLEDLRCDGSGHGGCQAGCKVYWKEAWLRRADETATPVKEPSQESEALDELLVKGTRAVRESKGVHAEAWRCQATEALKASEHLRGYDLSQYWRELTNGNFNSVRFVFLFIRAMALQFANRVGLLKPLPLHGPNRPSMREPLNLQPGDVVQVLSPAEIATTLDEAGLSDGLSFDREMLPYCGGTYRVKERVQRIIDDETGRMLNIRKDCLILEGTVCSGLCSTGRYFCPREIYPFWRESWLRRVDGRT